VPGRRGSQAAPGLWITLFDDDMLQTLLFGADREGGPDDVAAGRALPRETFAVTHDIICCIAA